MGVVALNHDTHHIAGTTSAGVLTKNASSKLHVRKDGTKAGAPDANDDSGDGYEIGSEIFDSSALAFYRATSVGVGTATWVNISSSGSPGGSDTHVQFNNSGAFGGSANLTWNGSTLGVTGTVAATTVTGANVTSGADPGHTHTAYSLTGHNHSGVYEPVISAGTTGQYWRGDKSWQTLDKTAVGLGNVENTALSTWVGTTNITTLGTITTGTWNASTVILPLGLVGTPSLTFTGDLNTGIYSPGADQVAIATGGVQRVAVDSAGTVTVTSVTAAQIIVTGWCKTAGASAFNGQITFGNTAAYQGHVYYDVNAASLTFDSTYDNAGYGFLWKTRTAGTAVTAAVLTGAGYLSLGAGTAPTFRLDVAGQDYNSSGVQVTRATNDTNGPPVAFRKSRGTLATPVVVSQNDLLGTFYFWGWKDAGARAAEWVPASGISGYVHNAAPTDHLVKGGVKILTNNVGDFTVEPTEVARWTPEGKFGVMTTAPDKQVEINSATGACLRLTYNDSDGSAVNYTDFDVSATGDLTITPSGNNLTVAAADVDIASDKAYYLGAPATDGTWRIVRSGNDLVLERRESGNYVTKQTITA